MKRLFSILVLCLLLCGCSHADETVKFYYVRGDYQSTLTDIIAFEERDASGHRNDLPYLLALYRAGPADDSLASLLPTGIQIQSVQNADGSIDLQLSDTSKTLSDSDFSLTCACLTLTCLDITDASTVNITSGPRSVTMNRSNLTLFDTITNTTVTEETK